MAKTTAGQIRNLNNICRFLSSFNTTSLSVWCIVKIFYVFIVLVVGTNILLPKTGYWSQMGTPKDICKWPFSSAKINNVTHQSNIHLCLINKSNKTLLTTLSGNFPHNKYNVQNKSSIKFDILLNNYLLLWLLKYYWYAFNIITFMWLFILHIINMQ